MKRGHKHRLLIYRRTTGQRRGLFLLAAIVLLALSILPSLVDAQTQAQLWPAEWDLIIGGFGVVCLVIFLYKLIAPRLPYVRCTQRNIRIQTPIYPLLVSYRRIMSTRPNQWGKVFPPETRTKRLRRILDPIAGEGVLLLDLRGWPVSPRLLRLFMPDVMFLPDGKGLVLWVPDWMALSREISHFTDLRREAALDRPDASVYSRMKRNE